MTKTVVIKTHGLIALGGTAPDELTIIDSLQWDNFSIPFTDSEMKIVAYNDLPEERRKDSERWERIFKTAVAEAKAENERLGIVEDYAKWYFLDDDDDSNELPLVAEDK